MTSDYLLIFIALISLLSAAAFAYLYKEVQNLKQDARLLAERIRRNNEDVAGLCSAAVELDQHIEYNDSQLNDIIDAVNAMRIPTVTSMPASNQTQSEIAQDYQNAIFRIHQGAGVEDLVKDCGLTIDEAVLLCRLHADK